MKTLLAIYLIFFKGYSVMRFDPDDYIDGGAGYSYGACNDQLGFDFGHNGQWGVGNTPQEAIYDCYIKTRNK